MKKITYLLVPFTAIFYFLLCYFTPFYLMKAFSLQHQLNWLIFIFSFGIVTSIIYGIFGILPALFSALFYDFLKFSKVAMSINSIFGLLGFLTIIYLIFSSPNEYFVKENGNYKEFMLNYMWKESALKTIIVSIQFLFFIVAFLYSTLLLPFITNEND